MPNPNVIVSVVNSIEPGVEEERFDALSHVYTVRFDHGQAAILSPDDRLSAVYLQVLNRLRRANLQAYVEIEPADRRIVDVQIPLADRVMRLTRLHSGDLEVELQISAAVHSLRQGVANRDEMLAELSRALGTGEPVLVTESVKAGIIDVRTGPENSHPPLEPRLATPCLASRPVTPKTAQQMFDLVASTSCCPATATAPCIPFLYPKDGCYARAHRMAQEIIAAGEEACKLWIYGRMDVPTVNDPSCAVHWGYHVVVTLTVATAGGPVQAIIDPALSFKGPATRAELIRALGTPPAISFFSTSVDIYVRDASGATLTAPSDDEVEADLQTFRTYLLCESQGKPSPPPYPKCQIGAQFVSPGA